MTELSRQQLDALRRQLEEEKQSYEQRLAQADHDGLSSSLGNQTGELSAYDNHPGDIATETYEREKDLALNENMEVQLAEIEQALKRMDQGNYGICEACGKPIPYERLSAVPTARYCVNDAPNQHLSDDRPVEEEVLLPPFGRSKSEAGESAAFDGEDAWQIVERWGNASSPAMAESREVDDYNEMMIEMDEPDGYVEPIESFLATDLFGTNVAVVRNRQYYEYLEHQEGDGLLEPDRPADDIQ
jgi:YteA family regulatory protein